jgi:hypothetical protein
VDVFHIDTAGNFATPGALVLGGALTLNGLAAGFGGTPLCVNILNVVTAGGCGGGSVSGTGTVGNIPIGSTTTGLGTSSLTDNATVVATTEPVLLSGTPAAIEVGSMMFGVHGV